MMFKDNFDRLCLSLVIASLVSIIVLLSFNTTASSRKQGAGLGKAAEREMANRARVELVERVYGHVETLKKSGQLQTSLLKLDELIRKYPAEAHGYILQGEILRDMGALDESVASVVQGIKLNGEYLDDKSPLSRRSLVVSLVGEGQKSVAERAAADPKNSSLKLLQGKINYLKSRLAGGCE